MAKNTVTVKFDDISDLESMCETAGIMVLQNLSSKIREENLTVNQLLELIDSMVAELDKGES